MKTTTAFLAISAGVLCGSSSRALAQDLIMNGGLETGSFSGWTTQPAAQGSQFGIFQGVAHTGLFSSFFGANMGFDDAMTQITPTTAGNLYRLSFWVLNQGAGNDRLNVQWEGASVFSQSPMTIPLDAWTLVTMNVVATVNGSTLTISGFDVPGQFYIDDVMLIAGVNNDDCASATNVSAGGAFTGTLVNATPAGATTCAPTEASPDAWYVFNAPAGSGGRLFADTCGTAQAFGLDTVISLQQGCGPQSAELDCNNDGDEARYQPQSACQSNWGTDSLVGAIVPGGSTTRIRVSRPQSASDTSFTLNVNYEPYGARNGGFEVGPGNLGTLDTGSTAIADWTVSRGNVDWSDSWQAADGARSVDLQGQDSSGGVQQLANTETGRRYRLTFWLAGNPDGGDPIKRMRVTADGTSADFTFNTTGRTYLNMGWAQQSMTFYATGASKSLIELYSTDASGSWGPVIDNVQLVEAPCAADFNRDNTVDLFDYLDFVEAFANAAAIADFNRDGIVDFFDYLDFVNMFSAGC